ncbi:SLC13 family permease [Allokutzneria sp. A3M-2-11 16]|uniref:SLC13 family permease n=1 Tax=Allokutzneria sp. A3M-2-11 16 TaxID=2962043 RepID=UPI0020B82490|nr:SLC13 family permease [Allokutzneria sp. A3M-2-11 16]MCP3803008.1 SLC13 family permease [Allokutzneria sp. A3M-2-11 16]
MSPELISILVLALVFALATTLSVNMGGLGFAAAFLVGTTVGGLTAEKVLGGFPGDIFVVLVGVTYLFGIARANGTVDRLVDLAVRVVGGRIAVIPWVMFGVTGLLTAIGAVSPAAVAIVAPIALNLANRYGINQLLMGALVVHGAQAGGFSPISVYGAIVNGVVERNHLPQNEIALFLASLVANAVIAVIVFVVFGGLKLGRADKPAEEATPREPITFHQVLTLLGLTTLVVLTLVFDLNVGLVAITIAVVLGVASPKTNAQAVNQITWPTVLLICGVLTYVSVLQQMGAVTYVGNAVRDVGSPTLAVLLLLLIGAIVSALASSVGVLGATIPLAVPLLSVGHIDPVSMVAALAVAATVVDVSPFSTNGAIVLANARDVDRDAFFKQLLRYGAIIVAAAPVALWAVLAVVG